jgi:hypothetical protein
VSVFTILITPEILLFALTPKYLTKLCTKIMFAGCIPFAIVALIMRSKMTESKIYLERFLN